MDISLFATLLGTCAEAMTSEAVLVLEPTGGSSMAKFKAWLVVQGASGDRVTPFEGGRPSTVEEETVEFELCMDHFDRDAAGIHTVLIVDNFGFAGRCALEAVQDRWKHVQVFRASRCEADQQKPEVHWVLAYTWRCLEQIRVTKSAKIPQQQQGLVASTK